MTHTRGITLFSKAIQTLVQRATEMYKQYKKRYEALQLVPMNSDHTLHSKYYSLISNYS